MLNSEQFDMTPGWRKPPRPGVAQQGKLFHGGPKPTEEQIQWARGYGPTRKRAIESHVREVYVPKYAHDESVREPIRQSPLVAEGAESLKAVKGSSHARVVDALARSTIDPEDLSGVHFALYPKNKPNVAGMYYRVNKGIELYSGSDIPPVEARHLPNLRRSYPGHYGDELYQAESTVLHEVGHHVSAQSGTPHSEYETSQQKGEEEAYADVYMSMHHRRHPKDPRPEASTREYTFTGSTFGTAQQGEESRTAYRHAFPVLSREMGSTAPMPGGREARRAWEQYENPKEEYRPQQQPHLFGRSADVSKTRGVLDYGQWGYEDYTKEGTHYLDQLRVGTPPLPEDRSKWNTGRIL